MIAGLKPYPVMKDSGVPWLGDVPEHWGMERAKWLFRKMDRPVRDADDVVTCFRDGAVTLRKNRRVRGFTESLKEIGYQGIRRGDLVIHAMDAFAGAVGVSDSDGKGTPVYSVCEPAPEADAHYYAYTTREMARSQWIQALAKGIRERSTDFRFDAFGSQPVPLLPLSEQAAIVHFLDHADRRIRRYIRTKQKLMGLLAERREALTEAALRMAGTRLLRIRVVADRIARLVNRCEDQVYTPIGLYNRGRGIFHKASTEGSDLGDSIFFWVTEGDLVLSGQFAWEGAVALASQEDDGCVASHRYPVLRGRPNIVESSFLLAFFRTAWGQVLLDHHSRGAAGRNRPLNAATLMKEKIPVPPLSAQEEVSSLVHLESRLRRSIANQVALLREYSTRLAADVVTGKLDVREAAAQLPVKPQSTEPEDALEGAYDETNTDEGVGLAAEPEEVEA